MVMRMKRKEEAMEMKLPVFRSKEECIEKFYLARESGPYKGPDPFDAKGLIQYEDRGLVDYICNDRFPCSVLVTLYAKMGLHRFNFLEGTNYKLSCVKKYNMSTGSAASSYFITLVAKDPATSSLQTFQTRVSEKSFGKLILTCSIARLRGTITKDRAPNKELWHIRTLPECPPVNPFENTERFYAVNKSELQDNYDWILLYLELAVATTDRSTRNHYLSNLKIVKVAMDTTEDANEEGLNAKNATFYIRYEDSCEARVGKDADRIAIVRRTFNAETGCFSLLGQNQSLEIIPKKGNAQLFFSRRLSVHKPWRLSSPRRRKAYKNRGFGLARRLLKTRSI